jgi:hypothetical protein
MHPLQRHQRHAVRGDDLAEAAPAQFRNDEIGPLGLFRTGVVLRMVFVIKGEQGIDPVR